MSSDSVRTIQKRSRAIDGCHRHPLLNSSRSTVSTSDFASRRFESVVFSRDHTVRTRFFSKERDALSGQAVARAVSDVRASGKKAFSEGSRRFVPFDHLKEYLISAGGHIRLSPGASLRFSLMGAILLGAVSTTMVFRYFGERVLARENIATVSSVSLPPSPEAIPRVPEVLGDRDEIDERFVNEVVQDLESLQKIEEKRELETKIRDMVSGYPIEDMVPFILEKDKVVAAFLVGIAKKESAWGKRVPLLNEHDCFNYWGYRGKRRLMGTGGHTCFNSPKDAIDTVSRRLEKLIFTEKVDTPAEMMVVWKCGYDCSAHNQADTRKWIQDVNLYFHELDE